MSDDFERLRRTMSELAEHGGSADLYERTLLTSRRLTRRRNALAGAGVAVAVLAISVPVALAGWQRSPAPPPPIAATPVTSPAPSAPSLQPSPSQTRPSSSTLTDSPTTPPATGCPVSAATLRKVADLPAGWRIEAGSIICIEGWAEGSPKAPTEAQQGDGVVLFRYEAGKWRTVVEGSAIECATHGVPERIGRRLSSCYYD